jgi:hypothetical protein
MVVGEGLFGALRLTLRAALKRVVSRCSTRTLIEGSHPSPRRTGSLGIGLGFCAAYEMVVGEGFEPSKSVTADLQSAPFGRSGIPPGIVMWLKMIQIQMVVGEGFEPSKSVTADLQSAPFGRSGIPPWPESFSLKAGRIIPNAIRV